VVAFAFFIVIVVVLITIGAARSSVGGYDRLAAKGVPARGILLQVSSIATKVPGTRLRRFESRSVTIDIEVPGTAPYVATVNAVIPSNLVRDVLPGATVELRVDPKNGNNIAIVGPGVGFIGFSALAAAPEQRAS
jgi:hypothetical protein